MPSSPCLTPGLPSRAVCRSGSRVTKRVDPAVFEAELSVGFHFLR